MFQGLRTAMPFYILYKGEPKISIGEVITCSNPIQSYNAYQPTFPPKTVDVKVKVGEDTLDFRQLPADSVIADYGSNGVVVSDNKDAIISEVAALKRSSEKALEETERHEHVVSECESILKDLNPQLRREAEQTEEIERLKSDLSDIKAMLAKALGHGTKKED